MASTGKYTRVGATKGPLTIGGAQKKMEEDPSFTYVPQFQIAGPLADVEAWLQENHADDASAALSKSYNVKNLKKATIAKAFQKEIDAWQESREQRTRERQEERNINLLILVELLKRYQEQRREHTTTEGGEKRTGRRTLRDKLSETVSAGKVMDVTKAQEKGRGITRVVMKKNSVKVRLSTDESNPLYNVVYHPQNEGASDGVRNFLTEFGGFNDSQIEQIVEAVTSGATVDVKRTLTPTAARPSSPLTKRFSSPLRRDQDSNVDDLLEGLNA